MGFFQDYIEGADKTAEEFKQTTASLAFKGFLQSAEKLAQMRQASGEVEVLQYTASQMRKSRIIKVPAEQLMLFANLERVHGQDYLQLHSPFEVVYIEPTNGSMSVNYCGHLHSVKGMLISYQDNIYQRSLKGKQQDAFVAEAFGLAPALQSKLIQVTWFLPSAVDFLNNYISTMIVSTTGELHFPMKDMSSGEIYIDTREMMTTWVIHILNYLTSPAVLMDEVKPSEKLNKARVARGKEPLPGWYEIRYKKQDVRRETQATGQGVKHGFRYDVRGHFMHFTKGRMAGRVIWCPPHQRGLANELYKPKVYRIEQNLDEQPELYGG